MSSDWQTFIDAVVADLTDNVDGLTDPITIHRYGAPWDPEQYFAQAGERHLSVSPVAAGASRGETTIGVGGSVEMIQVYEIAVWEDTTADSDRRKANEDLDAEFLTLENATRARFLLVANEVMGNSRYVAYKGTAFGGTSQTRFFRLQVETRHWEPIT